MDARPEVMDERQAGYRVKLFGVMAQQAGAREVAVRLTGGAARQRQELLAALAAQHPALRESVAVSRLAIDHEYAAADAGGGAGTRAGADRHGELADEASRCVIDIELVEARSTARGTIGVDASRGRRGGAFCGGGAGRRGREEAGGVAVRGVPADDRGAAAAAGGAGRRGSSGCGGSGAGTASGWWRWGGVRFAWDVAATHRAEAFAGMQRFIDVMKRDVPLWKVPVFAEVEGVAGAVGS